ncbi:hypothetical protein M8C21_003814, partial [Ambrosia artemisiifolia]
VQEQEGIHDDERDIHRVSRSIYPDTIYVVKGPATVGDIQGSMSNELYNTIVCVSDGSRKLLVELGDQDEYSLVEAQSWKINKKYALGLVELLPTSSKLVPPTSCPKFNSDMWFNEFAFSRGCIKCGFEVYGIA